MTLENIRFTMYRYLAEEYFSNIEIVGNKNKYSSHNSRYAFFNGKVLIFFLFSTKTYVVGTH